MKTLDLIAGLYKVQVLIAYLRMDFCSTWNTLFDFGQVVLQVFVFSFTHQLFFLARLILIPA
jgi:hypothetical protein